MSPACNRMSNNSVKFSQFFTGNVIGLGYAKEYDVIAVISGIINHA
jgi:hypothetical protein